MAKAELDVLLNKLTGRLKGDSKFYTTHRYGKTIISNYPLRRDPKKTTDSQRANITSFGERSKQAVLEKKDPERLAYWTERYEEYKKAANKNLAKANAQFFNIDPNTTPLDKQRYYKTLRGFIIGQLRKQE